MFWCNNAVLRTMARVGLIHLENLANEAWSVNAAGLFSITLHNRRLTRRRDRGAAS